MIRAQNIESAIYRELNNLGPCTFEELVTRLPDYSWNQIFAAVDRISREGTVTLRHPTPFGYLLSVTPRPSGLESDLTSSQSEALTVYRKTGS
jgi:hypothetical protein